MHFSNRWNGTRILPGREEANAVFELHGLQLAAAHEQASPVFEVVSPSPGAATVPRQPEGQFPAAAAKQVREH